MADTAGADGRSVFATEAEAARTGACDEQAIRALAEEREASPEARAHIEQCRYCLREIAFLRMQALLPTPGMHLSFLLSACAGLLRSVAGVKTSFADGSSARIRLEPDPTDPDWLRVRVWDLELSHPDARCEGILLEGPHWRELGEPADESVGPAPVWHVRVPQRRLLGGGSWMLRLLKTDTAAAAGTVRPGRGLGGVLAGALLSHRRAAGPAATGADAGAIPIVFRATPDERGEQQEFRANLAAQLDEQGRPNGWYAAELAPPLPAILTEPRVTVRFGGAAGRELDGVLLEGRLYLRAPNLTIESGTAFTIHGRAGSSGLTERE